MNFVRYQRQVVLPEIGVAGQEKIKQAKVLVVGAGGLGVPVLQYLVGMGIGTIGIIDQDVISLSNLHRQVLYRTDDVGKYKVEVAKSTLQQLNPEVAIITYSEALDQKNATGIVTSYDIVVDCTDNLKVRYLIDDVCQAQGKPFVYGALYKYEGQVGVFNYQGSPGYRHLFPDDQAGVDNCAEIGVLGVLPGIIGCYQAMEVIKIITGVGEFLAGKLLVVNAATTEHYTITLAPQKRKKEEVFQPTGAWVSWEDLDRLPSTSYQRIDIRPAAQFNIKHDERFMNVPFTQIFTFQPQKPKLVLVCERGQTTQQAAIILAAKYPELEIYQMKGGYSTK